MQHGPSFMPLNMSGHKSSRQHFLKTRVNVFQDDFDQIGCSVGQQARANQYVTGWVIAWTIKPSRGGKFKLPLTSGAWLSSCLHWKQWRQHLLSQSLKKCFWMCTWRRRRRTGYVLQILYSVNSKKNFTKQEPAYQRDGKLCLLKTALSENTNQVLEYLKESLGQTWTRCSPWQSPQREEEIKNNLIANSSFHG